MTLQQLIIALQEHVKDHPEAEVVAYFEDEQEYSLEQLHKVDYGDGDANSVHFAIELQCIQNPGSFGDS